MSPPANWTPITVTGTYIHPDGSFATGTVTFTSEPYLRDPDLDLIVVPQPVQVTLNGSGHFTTTLMATDDPDIDPSFFYTVTEVIGGKTTSFALEVPKDTIGGVMDLADVDRNATIPAPPEVYVRTVNGMYGDIATSDVGIPDPAITVVTETAFGQSSAVGALDSYAREDHTHGTPTAPSVPTASGSVATATTYGTASTAGAAATFSKGDHNHGSPSLTANTPTAEAVGSTGSVGAGTAAAKDDHRHAMPTSATAGASAVADTASAGVAATLALSDHRHSREAFATPITQAFADVAAAGAATTIPRSDHKHGMPAAPTASSVGAVPTTTATGFNAGLLSARPAAGTALRFYYATDLNTMFEDTGSAWVQLDQSPAIANSWTAVGHSYLQFNASSYNQRSRLDSILRARWDAESTNWANLAIAGSRLIVDGAAQGGWVTFAREINKLPGKTSPYTSSDGGLLICTGINDLGTLGGATAQNQTSFGHAMRFVWSRWRASTIKEDTDASVTYGASWTAETGKFDISSSGTEHFTATTSTAFTITLPADYGGEPVAISLIGRAGVNGGIVTWSGTAGVTGTTSTDNILLNTNLSNVPVVKRITNLTSANASQTIIGTVTTNNGLVYLDSWWLEALEAPPIVCCNIPRLTAAAYTAKYPSWVQQTGTLDSDVAAFNTVITNLKVNEFDGMVQIADIDAVLNKTASLFVNASDQHPNERGAALMADEIDNARRRFTLTGVKSAALNMNMAPRYSGGLRKRRATGYYHTAEFLAAGTTYTLVAGDVFAIPFEVTEMDEKYTSWALEKAAVGTGSPTIRWGIYADYMNKGYPDIQLQEFTSGGVLTLTAATGVQLTPGGQFTWYADIGLYWKVIKIETVGTGTWTLSTLSGPNPHVPQMSTAGLFNVTTPAPRAVGYKLTGQATGSFLTTATTFPANAVPVLAAPYIGALKA